MMYTVIQQEKKLKWEDIKRIPNILDKYESSENTFDYGFSYPLSELCCILGRCHISLEAVRGEKVDICFLLYHTLPN